MRDQREGKDLRASHSIGLGLAVSRMTMPPASLFSRFDVKAGDRILFGKWSGTEMKLGNEELLSMKESDVLGIIEGQPAAKRKAA